MEILNPDLLENFSNSFNRYNSKYKLSYYIKEKNSNKSKSNTIHSSIIWSRKVVQEINELSILSNKDITFINIITLINLIDILLESTDQIYRVLYNVTTINPFIDKNDFIFTNAPCPYNQLNNRDYFKEIRAMLYAHPTNLKCPDNIYRHADIPNFNKRINKLRKRDCDIHIKLWTNTKNDSNSILFPIYINDLVCFIKLIYSQFEIFDKRLKCIVKKAYSN